MDDPSTLPPPMAAERTRIINLPLVGIPGVTATFGVPLHEQYGSDLPTYKTWSMYYPGMAVSIVYLPPSNMLITSSAVNEANIAAVRNVPGAAKAIVQQTN